MINYIKRYGLPITAFVAGYAVAFVSQGFLPEFISMLIPGGAVLVSIGAFKKQKSKPVPIEVSSQSEALPPSGRRTGIPAVDEAVERRRREGVTERKAAPAATASAPKVPNPQPSAASRAAAEPDDLWDPVHEYISVIEELIISEGQKNALDNEIVEKTMSLLVRISRLIPQLKELNDSKINHNIQRLVFKDLNGAINPFLKLSGEAKRKNRRLLLDGIKDIDSRLSLYVETIEHRDLIELQSRIDLIQQRYRTSD
ncbi:hypothetical protein [Saccharibacillus kuerlensis]|uniref:5-bromo-4-chloroindolyl phosphate hydrolysis protein n=1 Tax=Saccharibacillus kuerlensis TaxID=459527 RepID=A0ABQ2L2X3_9BACL|nr:hypothetical protein [Saccharibacillus kuerlensis]GGN98958.1 hypothetical protein GCM10010969_18670 [Saccharibacillus kuerlensis]